MGILVVPEGQPNAKVTSLQRVIYERLKDDPEMTAAALAALIEYVTEHNDIPLGWACTIANVRWLERA